jgi:hypothetical protein
MLEYIYDRSEILSDSAHDRSWAMKLKQFIKWLDETRFAEPACAREIGVSRKGNRKLEIQQFILEPCPVVGDTIEYESLFIVVIDNEENVLNWAQTV